MTNWQHLLLLRSCSQLHPFLVILNCHRRLWCCWFSQQGAQVKHKQTLTRYLLSCGVVTQQDFWKILWPFVFLLCRQGAKKIMKGYVETLTLACSLEKTSINTKTCCLPYLVGSNKEKSGQGFCWVLQLTGVPSELKPVADYFSHTKPTSSTPVCNYPNVPGQEHKCLISSVVLSFSASAVVGRKGEQHLWWG